MPAEQKRQIPSESGNDGTLDGSESPAQERAASREVPTSDLPTDVRVKLRKLDKLESKYHGPSVLPFDCHSVLTVDQSYYDRTVSPMLESRQSNLSRRP